MPLNESGIAAEVWQRFEAAPRTLGPTEGARDRWRRGRSSYAVWVLRVTDARVVERAREAQQRLSGVIRPLALEDLHVTVHVAGFPASAPAFDDDISETALQVQREAVAGLGGETVRLEVGGLNAFLSCAMLDVADPHGDLARLRARLAVASPELRFGPYHAHVTVGCFDRERSTAPLVQRVRGARNLEAIAVDVAEVELVEFDAALEGASLRTRWRVS